VICIGGGTATHQRAGAIDADFKTDPTAGSVACDGSWIFLSFLPNPPLMLGV